MPIRITEIREVTRPIASAIRNAYIDFSKMTTSLVAVVTNVVRDGKPVVGYGFSLRIIAAQILSGSKFSPVASSSEPGSASSTRGINRSRSSPAWP